MGQSEQDLKRALRWCQRLFYRVGALQSELDMVQRQMERIGAPLYRRKGNLYIQRVKNLPTPDYKLRTK